MNIYVYMGSLQKKFLRVEKEAREDKKKRENKKEKGNKN